MGSRAPGVDLEAAARVAEAAADAARAEILPRFRRVDARAKADGSPVTEADLAAERAVRRVLGEALPDHVVAGEELGGAVDAGRPTWLVDPIDGTISFSRGIPLFATIVSLLVGGEPVLGLIDLPALDERYLGWKGGGCRRNGEPVRCSQRPDLVEAIVAHGDPYAFEREGRRAGFERLAARVSRLRGYTDAFGHAMVLGGGADAMVDLHLSPWDAAATRVLVPEAGGALHEVPSLPGKSGLVFGSPPLVELLADWFR